MSITIPSAEEVRAIVREELARAFEAAKVARPPQGIASAARELGVSARTLRRRIRAGELPVVRVGRRVLVDVGALRPAPEKVARLAVVARSAIDG